MQIQLKLMGMLKAKTPPDGSLALSEGGTIEDVLQDLGIAADAVHVFTVNGSLVRDRAHVLSDGDELTLLPPVGGG